MDLRTQSEQLKEALEVKSNINEGHNFIIRSQNSTLDFDDLIPQIFGDTTTIAEKFNVDMFDILVEIGAFKSKSDAKNNWKKSDKNIDDGCSAWIVGKKRIPLFIWKVPKV